MDKKMNNKNLQSLLPSLPDGECSRTLMASMIETPLGPMLAIADEKALHLLEFPDRKGFKRDLAKFGQKLKAAIVPGRTKAIDSIEKELSEYFKGKLKTFKTPIALLGTDFQKQVWLELQKIPSGETRSYAEIAESLGKPTAYRAVAQANGTNRLVIIIPCHRVINANGAIGGYGAGIPRKKMLLELEQR